MPCFAGPVRPGPEPGGQTNAVGCGLAVGRGLLTPGVVVARVLVVGWSSPVHEASISPARTRLIDAQRRDGYKTPPQGKSIGLTGRQGLEPWTDGL